MFRMVCWVPRAFFPVMYPFAGAAACQKQFLSVRYVSQYPACYWNVRRPVTKSHWLHIPWCLCLIDTEDYSDGSSRGKGSIWGIIHRKGGRVETQRWLHSHWTRRKITGNFGGWMYCDVNTLFWSGMLNSGPSNVLVYIIFYNIMSYKTYDLHHMMWINSNTVPTSDLICCLIKT